MMASAVRGAAAGSGAFAGEVCANEIVAVKRIPASGNIRIGTPLLLTLRTWLRESSFGLRAPTVQPENHCSPLASDRVNTFASGENGFVLITPPKMIISF